MIVQTYDPCVPTELRQIQKLTFAANGAQILLDQSKLNSALIEVIEVILQPDVAVQLQLIEGTIQGNVAAGVPFSAAWILNPGMVWSEPGKKIYSNLCLTASGPCNVQAEVRYFVVNQK